MYTGIILKLTTLIGQINYYLQNQISGFQETISRKLSQTVKNTVSCAVGDKNKSQLGGCKNIFLEENIWKIKKFK